MDGNLTPLQRLFLAFLAFFYVLMKRDFAEEVKRLRDRQREALPPDSPIEQPPPAAAKAPAEELAPPHLAAVSPAEEQPSDQAEALHVLSLLQRDGRLLDFVSESLEGFSDREVGAAARTVHAGCKKVVESYVQLEPVLKEPEGASVTLPPGFDPATIRLTGNVVGSPPFTGSLRHHGWRATSASFPPLAPSQDVRILAPAEVEL